MPWLVWYGCSSPVEESHSQLALLILLVCLVGCGGLSLLSSLLLSVGKISDDSSGFAHLGGC